MIGHNFKYTLKTLFRSKMLIFWTFAFPIILGTFFQLAFSNIESSEKLSIIPIAIVENQEFTEDSITKEVFQTLSDETNEEQLFTIDYTNEETAKNLLAEEKIKGYVIKEEDKIRVLVNTSGIDETIIKQVVDEIMQTKEMAKNLAESEVKEQLATGKFAIHYEEIQKKVTKTLEQTTEGMTRDTSSSHLSYTMIEFYTLIAMTCLYGGILGMVAINNCLPNMSSKGMRVAVSPASKGKLVFSSVLASFLTQLVGVALLFIYTIFVLKVDYGNQIGPILLLAFVGSLAGLTLGLVIGTIVKASDNTKTGILIAVTMFGCFLSGMMGITMKYMVDTSIPILNKINPASMITDGFYSLYYYDTMSRYWFDIGSLLIFAFLMITLSFLVLRRQKYDSI